MTHKEAVQKSLEMLGGKATLKQIYPIAIKLIGKNTQSKDIKATIRRELNSSPFFFKSTPNEEGSWELLSYQAELKKKDDMIANLYAQLLAKEDEIKSIKTEDDFIYRLLEKLKTIWKDDKKTIAEFRKMLDALGRTDVVAELDMYFENKAGKSKKQNSKATKIVVNGDLVTSKNVANEVNNVAAGATGINVQA